MPDTPLRRIVAVDDDAAGTVVDALRAAAGQRQRAATRLAAEALGGPDAKADPRPDALRIARVLLEAARLAEVADNLAAAEARPTVDVTVTADTAAAAEALTAAGDKAAGIDLAAAAQPTTPPTGDEVDDDDVAEALAAMGMTQENPE